MWTLPADALTAIRSSHVRFSTCTFRDPGTGKATPLPLVAGVVVDDATQPVRRTLTLSLAPSQKLYDLLDVPGGEITCRQVLRFPGGAQVTIPQGVYVVDQDQLASQSGSTLDLTCPDRWVKVQRARFTVGRASVPTNPTWREIQRLVENAFAGSVRFPGWAQLDTTAAQTVGSLRWDDGDRSAAVTGMATDSGLEVFADRTGMFVLRRIPPFTSTTPAVAKVDVGVRGVLTDSTRSRDRSVVRNTIVAWSTASDIVFDPVVAQNTTVGDPLSVHGALGIAAEDYTSANFRNSAQALTAARARLSTTLGEGRSLTLESSGNPALDSRDVIRAQLANTDPTMPRPTELHVIDRVTHPVMVRDGSDVQQITTRSTRPDSDSSG